jgi:hypothetical protein
VKAVEPDPSVRKLKIKCEKLRCHDCLDKLMNRLQFFLITAAFVASLVFITGCGGETNQQRALSAKHNAEMRRLLVALEMFRAKSGQLPPTLEELQKSDSDVRDINIEGYKYSSEGILVADGTQWLLTLPDPKDNTQLLVGRLPVEVAVRRPKQE